MHCSGQMRSFSVASVKPNRCNVQHRRTACRASADSNNESARLLSALAAGVLALSAVDASLLTTPVKADDSAFEEQAATSPAERARLAFERRRALLDQARQSAMQKAADVTDSAQKAAENTVSDFQQKVQDAADSTKQQFSSGTTQSSGAASLAEPKDEKPWWERISEYSGDVSPNKLDAAAQNSKSLKPEAPAPAAKQEPAKQEPAKQQIVKQAETAKAPEKPGKRKGPLPLFLAQLLVLLGYVGVVLGSTKYANEVGGVIDKVKDAASDALSKAQSAASKSQS